MFQLRDGLFAPWHGLQYMWRHPALWRHAIVPVVLNLLITLAILLIFAMAIVALTIWLHDKFPHTLLGRTGEVVTVIGLVLAAVGGSAASWLLLQGILCGHFNAKLAQQVEIQLGMPRDEMTDVPLSYQVVDTVRNTAYLLGVNAIFLLLHLIPVVGSIVAVCGSLYFDCLIFGREYLDHPLALRGWRRHDKLKFFGQHRMQVLGLGMSALLLNFVPVVGAVMLTTAVTGAVLLHRKLANSGSLRGKTISL